MTNLLKDEWLNGCGFCLSSRWFRDSISVGSLKFGIIEYEKNKTGIRWDLNLHPQITVMKY